MRLGVYRRTVPILKAEARPGKSPAGKVRGVLIFFCPEPERAI
jgi:hypothetical protein